MNLYSSLHQHKNVIYVGQSEAASESLSTNVIAHYPQAGIAPLQIFERKFIEPAKEHG